MLDTLSAEYLAAARGLFETRLLFAHALKPTAMPVEIISD